MTDFSPHNHIVDPATELAGFDTDTAPAAACRAVKHDLKTFADSLLGGEHFAKMPIPKRERQMGTWMRQGDLGFIFGQRGQGKTWFALSLALALGHGIDFGPWHVPKKHRVLYVDGEMPLEDLRDRAMKLGGIPDGFAVLSHEQHFTVLDAQLNLALPEDQQRLVETVKETGTEVVIVDNLSCLFGGVRENDADDWDKVLPWLFRLRRMKITVIVMHHANRVGHEMRGTSRREDAAFWVLRLVKQENPVDDGKTRFSVEFTKNRQGEKHDTERLLWTLEKGPADNLRLLHEPFSPLESFIKLVQDGVAANKEIATELGVSTATVTRLAQAAKTQGRIKIERGRYLPVS